MRAPRSTTLITGLLGTSIVFACLDDAPVVPGPPSGILPPAGSAQRASVSAALHLHGLSNHGANSRPASIAWHTQQYATGGVQLIWWTDHTDTYFGRIPDLVITPRSPVEVYSGIWSVGTWGPVGQARAFLRSGRVPVVDSAARRVTVSLPEGTCAEPDTVELFFGDLGGTQPRRSALTMLSRALVGRPVFSMSIRPLKAGGSFPEVSVMVPLAWHPRDEMGYRQVLRYRYGTGVDSSTLARGDTIEFTRSWSGIDSSMIRIDPATDALLLPDGLDNTTDAYVTRFVVPCSNTDQQLSFSFPTIANGASSAATQMPPARDLAHEMAAAYGIRATWGLEVPAVAGPIAGTRWYSVIGAGRHIVMLLPGDASPSLESMVQGTAADIGTLAKSLGGVTSIAHPFGTSTGAPVGSESDQRDQARQLGAFLVQNNAWGANLIEVGSIRRGLVGIRGHLDLLDYLWASGFRLCGVGVTDSHGGLLLRDPRPGVDEDQYNFVTWIGGVDRFAPEQELVTALRSCNTSFGDAFYTRGGLWLDVEVDSVQRQLAIIDADGVSPSADLFLFEGEIDSTGVGHDPMYRRYAMSVTRLEPIPVGGCRSGFARLEAWVGDRPIAFSNVVTVAADSARCTAQSGKR